MSIEALNWALQQPLKGCQKFVLLVLGYHANNTNECWPNLKTIAKECGITRASVISHLNKITTLGLVEKIKRFDERGYRRSTLYKLNLNQSIKFQSKKNQRRDFDNQGQNFDTSKVKDLDGNIIERSLEQTMEQANSCEAKASPSIASKNPFVASNDVQEIFSYWQTKMNRSRAVLDLNREKLIACALKLGYSKDDLKQAIDGCANTPFYMGKNDRNKKYDDFKHIFRDASKIEEFIENAINPPSETTVNQSKNNIMLGVI